MRRHAGVLLDVQAARAAAVEIIGLASGWSAGDLSGAVAVYDDPAHLLAAWDESPLGGACGSPTR